MLIKLNKSSIHWRTRRFSSFSASSQILSNWSSKYRHIIGYCLQHIENDSNYNDIAAKVYEIPLLKWTNFLIPFRRRLIVEPESFLNDDEITKFLKHFEELKTIDFSQTEMKLDPKSSTILSELYREIFDKAIEVASVELNDSITANKSLINMSDMRLPHEWYPRTRLMKRKIIFHGGPTNSGKTYQALKRLIQADPLKGGGIYCGPLRLLALEVYEKLNREGVYTSLLTGQEKREVPFATHLSCTIEMMVIDKEYDVAVIDEIQMIGDIQRGYAWTKAILGLRAKEIHVCGGIEGLEIVQKLIESTGDEFIFQKYERLSTLK